MDCTPFPAREPIALLPYVTHGILVPVLFGIGLMGNFVTMVLSNHASVRKDSAVFVHICALSVTNAMVLLCTVPETLQEVELFPANVTFSRPMAYADMVCYVFGHIGRHSALWITAALGLLTLRSGRSPCRKSRMARNGTNRIVVFVLVLLCALVNFPRLLEVSVREVKGHCFVGMSIWSFEATEFGGRHSLADVYPWIVTGLCHALPAGLILFAALLLWRQAGWRRLPRSRIALRPAVDPEQRRLGLVKTVWIVLFVAFALELPTLAVRIAVHVTGLQVKDDVFLYGAKAIADYLTLIQTSVGFFIYAVYCSDFRKALRRSFCCLCSDEFYEPCACCSAAYRRHLREIRKLDETDDAGWAARHVTGRDRHRKRDGWCRKPPRVADARRGYDTFDVYRNGSVHSGASVSMTTASGYPSESVTSMPQYDVIVDTAEMRSAPHGEASPSSDHVADNGCVSRDSDDVHPWV